MPLPRKQVAKGSIVKINAVVLGRVETANPPGITRAEVEAPELNPVDELGDPLTLDPVELGDEERSEFPFTEYWDPVHADTTTVDGYLASGEEVTVQIVTPHTPAITIEFAAKIKSAMPAELSRRSLYKRTVTAVRTGPITYTPAVA